MKERYETDLTYIVKVDSSPNTDFYHNLINGDLLLRLVIRSKYRISEKVVFIKQISEEFLPSFFEDEFIEITIKNFIKDYFKTIKQKRYKKAAFSEENRIALKNILRVALKEENTGQKFISYFAPVVISEKDLLKAQKENLKPQPIDTPKITNAILNLEVNE